MPDTSFLLALLAQSVLVPFAAAGAMALALRRAVGAPAAMALAVAAGFVASYAATVQGPWPWPPNSAMDWQPWVVVAAAGAAWGLERWRSTPARLLARLMLATLLGFVLVWPAIGSFGIAKAVAAALAAGLLMAAAWSVRTHAVFGAGTHPLRLAAIAGAAGLAMMLDSSQTAGRLAGAVAAALAACALLGRLRATLGPAAVGTTILVLGTLLLQAHLYAGFPLGYVALLLAAALADVAPAAWAPRDGASAWGARAASLALTLAPLLVVVGLAVKGLQDAGGY